jgi:protein-histidine pros-kinase
MIVIALGAALGARWLAGPMRRLSRAAGELAHGFGRREMAPVLDERRGTREVREAAQVFNGMATRLREQFDARGLHMAALSHDLRTPLTRLRLRLEQWPEAAAQSAVNDVREMDEMIDMTLAVLREQRDALASPPVDMASLLQAVADDLVEQGHDVALATEAVAVRARAHPAAVRRIVGNLVGNALRHGTHARIGLARRGAQVEVTVDDDGPGIPADRLEQVFEPWVRLAGAHERAGHGLGLAIARDLAERDGGRLSLANRPEGGLRATLRLPSA